jgi:hypothetical protein
MSVAAKNETPKKISADEMRKMREKDNRLVKGIFRCYEPRGGSFTFNYKKYRGDQVQKYTMVDGNTYEVPMMVARHLNNDCWYPRHSHVLDAAGNPIVDGGKKVQRCSFDSLEFTMDE